MIDHIDVDVVMITNHAHISGELMSQIMNTYFEQEAAWVNCDSNNVKRRHVVDKNVTRMLYQKGNLRTVENTKFLYKNNL